MTFCVVKRHSSTILYFVCSNIVFFLLFFRPSRFYFAFESIHLTNAHNFIAFSLSLSLHKFFFIDCQRNKKHMFQIFVDVDFGFGWVTTCNNIWWPRGERWYELAILKKIDGVYSVQRTRSLIWKSFGCEGVRERAVRARRRQPGRERERDERRSEKKAEKT